MRQLYTALLWIFGAVAVCGAGETLADYVSVTGTPGNPVMQIPGHFGPSDFAALYRIHIASPGSFSATTTQGPVGVDTRLALFTLSGAGIATNDDQDFGETRSTLPIGNSLYAGLPAGDYLLGISAFETLPYATDETLLFDTATQGIQGPSAPGTPLGFWAHDPISDNGDYLITLTGVTSVVAVKLNVATSPSTTTAGVGQFVNAVGSGFPTGPMTPANTTVSLATACGSPALVSTTAASLTRILDSTYRISFQVPASLSPGTYYVSLRNNGIGEADYVSSNCSQLVVQ